MKNFAGAIVAFSVVFAFSLVRAMPPGLPPLFMEDKELRDLISEATSLALIRSLALTPEQRAEMKQILKPIRAEFEIMENAEKESREAFLKPRLRQLIADLKEGKETAPPGDEKRQEIEAIRSRMTALFVEADQALERILALLSEEQRERLQGFRFFEEYLEMTPALDPRKLLHMGPLELIQKIRESSNEDIDRLAQDVARRRAGPEAFEGEGDRGEALAKRLQLLVDLARKIHAMPQSEFDAKAELLKQELKALSAGPEGGPPWRGGHGEGPKPPRFGPKGLDAKGIVFSESFYDAL